MDFATRLALLRSQGWSLASHQDVKVGGAVTISYLFLHSSGVWVRGEGSTELDALEAVETAAQHRLLPSDRLTTPQLSRGAESLPDWLTRLQAVVADDPFITLDRQDFVLAQHILPCLIAADQLATALARVDSTRFTLERAAALVPPDIDNSKMPDDDLNEILIMHREAEMALQDAETMADNARRRYEWARHHALDDAFKRLSQR